jgi:hypothetical protein
VYVQKTSNAQMRKFVMPSGNVMQDQFKPWCFGIAFAFLFEYFAGMPDVPVGRLLRLIAGKNTPRE